VKDPEPGDPEVRIRIPVRSSISTKISKGKSYAAVSFNSFLHSTVTFEVHDARAARKLVEAFKEAEAICAAQDDLRRSQRPTEPKKRKVKR